MNIDSYFLILLVINIILILYIGLGVVENFAASDDINELNDPTEAIENIASMYNKDLIQATNVMATGDLTVSGKVSFLPKGSIIAYHGPTVPDGWVICDGNNGTPDLRGRFIMGQGSGTGLTQRAIGQKGGEETHKLSISEIPSHSHSVSVTPADAGGYCKTGPCGVQTSDRKILDDSRVKGISVNYTGGSQPHNNLPPFLVLYYIMKTI
jgi:hypothetical protein